MKRILAAALLSACAFPSAAEEVAMKEDDKVMYALGAAIARDLSAFSLSPKDLKFLSMGLKDAVEGKSLKVDLKEYGPKINDLAATRAKAGSKAFIEKASKEKGAVKTASGLIYIEMKAGTGASPKAEDKVKVHYHGTFPDGKVFDSSVQRGQPAEFPLNGVIPCWTEGVQKMKVGGKSKLICPSDIAYGDKGRPGIPGGATLVFEVELLDILKKEAPAK